MEIYIGQIFSVDRANGSNVAYYESYFNFNIDKMYHSLKENAPNVTMKDVIKWLEDSNIIKKVKLSSICIDCEE